MLRYGPSRSYCLWDAERCIWMVQTSGLLDRKEKEAAAAWVRSGVEGQWESERCFQYGTGEGQPVMRLFAEKKKED